MPTPPLGKIHQSTIHHFTIYNNPRPLIAQPRVKTLRYNDYYSYMRRISYGNNAVQCNGSKPFTKPFAYSSQSPNLLPISVNHPTSCRLQSITQPLQWSQSITQPLQWSQSITQLLQWYQSITYLLQWSQSITQPLHWSQPNTELPANSSQSPKLLQTPVNHATFAVIPANHQTCQHGKS